MFGYWGVALVWSCGECGGECVSDGGGAGADDCIDCMVVAGGAGDCVGCVGWGWFGY